MLSRPMLSKSAVGFSAFVSLLVALVELAIANFSLFYCSENQPRNQHLTLQQAIAHSTSFSLFPGQLLTAQQAIANLNLFSFSTKQAIAAVLGQYALLRFLALYGSGGRVF